MFDPPSEAGKGAAVRNRLRASLSRGRPERMSNRLEVIDTAKSFGGVLALSEATLTAESKKILAIIGPNGAGKTTSSTW